MRAYCEGVSVGCRQCSRCVKIDNDAIGSDNEVNPNAPMKLREKIKEPAKFTPSGLREKRKVGKTLSYVKSEMNSIVKHNVTVFLHITKHFKTLIVEHAEYYRVEHFSHCQGNIDLHRYILWVNFSVSDIRVTALTGAKYICDV